MRKQYYEYMIKATAHLTADELGEFSRLYREREKSLHIAYLSWGLGGIFGLHRIYTGNYGTALILFGITFFTLGLGGLAGLYDVTNVNRIVFEANKGIILQTVKDVKRK